MTAPVGAVHPQVARAKYDRELAQFTRDAGRHRSLGVFLMEAVFPTVLVGFASPKLKPPAFVFAMLVDYTDYDLLAPSVRFVNPFSGVPYKSSEMPTKMLRTIAPPTPVPFPFPGAPGAPGAPASDGDAQAAGAAGVPAMGGLMFVEQQALLQDYGPDDVPFLCLPGVREYHDHPGHSGDAWELHRPTGAGSLVRLTDVVRTYAVDPVGGWAVTLMPQVSIGYGEAPQ